jgi:hypothetical protein
VSHEAIYSGPDIYMPRRSSFMNLPGCPQVLVEVVAPGRTSAIPCFAQDWEKASDLWKAIARRTPKAPQVNEKTWRSGC